MSANLERRQIGEQFKLIDPPRLPDRPIAPDWRQYVGIGAGAGAAIVLLIMLLVYTLRENRSRHTDANAPASDGSPAEAAALRRRSPYESLKAEGPYSSVHPQRCQRASGDAECLACTR